MRDLTDEFKRAVRNSNASFLDEISSRKCSSENWDGIEYRFFGPFVPVRPIIDVVAEVDSAGIEHLSHTNDGRTCLTVFVAEVPEQSHPAFV